MTNKRIYNFFLFLSTLTRSLVEVFSVILLYNKGYSINNILFFLLVMYLSGILVNYLSLIINYKVVLVFSILLYGVSYIYLSFMGNNLINLIVFAVILSFSSYSYHAIRHSLALYLIDYNEGKNINKFLIITYIAVMISNVIGIFLIEKLPILVTGIVILVLSFISVVPVLKLKNIKKEKINLSKVAIPRNKIFFNILEQFKVILLELQPLYLYIYVKKSISYVGTFNILINLASLIVMLFISKRVTNKYFRYVNILLGIVLIFKFNIDNSIILLFIALLEGIGIKLYEKFSLNNLYDVKRSNINSYLIVEEFIFFITKSVLMVVFILLVRDLKLILYICILGIVISGFYIRDKS